jgi:protein arginine N-methyltransferase 5
VDYVRHLWTSRPPLDDTQAFESPFYDYLQIPLQPLADNLESNTYEVFEQDPVK